MKTELIQSLTEDFEAHAQQTDNGVEFWLARDLQHLLGYSKWDNFLNVVSKAKTACEVSGYEVPDHFPDVGKMVGLGSGSRREVPDIMLTRYACYLIAQNGDPRKAESFAQIYKEPRMDANTREWATENIHLHSRFKKSSTNKEALQ